MGNPSSCQLLFSIVTKRIKEIWKRINPQSFLSKVICKGWFSLVLCQILDLMPYFHHEEKPHLRGHVAGSSEVSTFGCNHRPLVESLPNESSGTLQTTIVSPSKDEEFGKDMFSLNFWQGHFEHVCWFNPIQTKWAGNSWQLRGLFITSWWNQQLSGIWLRKKKPFYCRCHLHSCWIPVFLGEVSILLGDVPIFQPVPRFFGGPRPGWWQQRISQGLSSHPGGKGSGYPWGYPKNSGLLWKILLEWMIWGYPHFRKPPYQLQYLWLMSFVCIYIYIHTYVYTVYVKYLYVCIHKHALSLSLSLHSTLVSHIYRHVETCKYMNLPSRTGLIVTIDHHFRMGLEDTCNTLILCSSKSEPVFVQTSHLCCGCLKFDCRVAVRAVQDLLI